MILALRFTTLGFVPLLFLLSGCGGDAAVGGQDRQPVSPVSGTVKHNGTPVADAVVIFSPKGNFPEARGTTDSAGKYQLTTYDPNDGAAAGDYLVMVVKVSPVAPAPVMHDPNFDPDKAAKPTAEAPAASRSLIPTKYASLKTTDLKATVKADGSNEIPLELK
jgi:hypothetical protein